ncbi:tRNA1(Val) (adenine(37)-N6)-methyltransferase [Companilactobacillus allii]|uniref:SAM-dependent methyltransferase n=1 Tax=Companilactobacillus allii TaxID=1847728 RepID=A0A1P8Q440_9LACO|nr:tRNA1(Val) (adenine(37)-N6)-methyltransferase [Companilactobacillus allii]APX72621.1 SAM-dependent methyltransferase [Companilactobacillus allii]USQ69725.1 tRNA1(Val) (adenine(37)-N6)-methyltransferase [Companilactobacillus allii]
MSNISKDIISNSGITINQNKELYSFNLDTILLYNFARPIKKGKIVDLCSGNGALGLSLASKTSAHIYLVELQKELSKLAEKSLVDNDLMSQVTSINDDIKNVQKYLHHDSIDMIVCNPPYFTSKDSTIIKDNPILAIARHELKTDLNEVLYTIKVLLKENSHVYIVYRPDRLSELFSKMSDNKIQPKRIRFVRSHINDDANLVLVDAIKTVKESSLKVEPDLIMYENDKLSLEAKKQIEGI